MSGYSPNWSPGTPLEPDEEISDAEKVQLYNESKAAGNWTQEDDDAFWADDPAGKPEGV